MVVNENEHKIAERHKKKKRITPPIDSNRVEFPGPKKCNACIACMYAWRGGFCAWGGSERNGFSVSVCVCVVVGLIYAELKEGKLGWN